MAVEEKGIVVMEIQIEKVNRKIDLIVVHCSATKETSNYTPEMLERDHKARGFRSAGYNYYIRKSGEIVPMRPLEQIPAHAKGYNSHSIGVCYEGGLDANGKPCDTRTEAQKDSLWNLLMKLVAVYPECEICGHRDLSPDLDGDGEIEPYEWIKVCPCFNAKEEYKNL